MTQYATAHMPPRAPLEMAEQEFSRAPDRISDMPPIRFADRLWRLAAFAPAIAMTLLLSTGLGQWLSEGGVTFLEASVVVLVGLTFIWVSLSVSTVAVGLLRRLTGSCRPVNSGPRQGALRVGLLVPVYNEVPEDVFGNAKAMLDDLVRARHPDLFDLFILSDTNDPQVAALEERAFHELRGACPEGVTLYYRRRAKNIDKKVGNIADWLENWGGSYDAMLILDADSLMSGAAIRHLTRELAADPQAGLIQSFPALIGAETLFGRMQQFSNSVYGWLLAEGLALWSQREGNYWGHNAIIRTRAFAESARLPYLRGWGGRQSLIMSHDFVEAGMLRRAGWGVRFLPRAGGSYEETPQTLIDYALRDRRWCRGNLQHLRLLAAAGFHPVTRFHLLQGAVAFLMSPAWFALIIIWSLVGNMMPEQAAVYFSPSNPLYPMWPDAMGLNGTLYLVVIYAMLLLPKITSTLALGTVSRTRAAYGGWLRFLSTTLFEILCSVIYAPIMMIQQTKAVFWAIFARGQSWSPQQRGTSGYGWGAVLRFHWLETAVGLAMCCGLWTGLVSYWLLPIVISLTTAVPLSKLSGVRLTKAVPGPVRLESPQNLREPRIVRAAKEERAWMRAQLNTDKPTRIAAE